MSSESELDASVLTGGTERIVTAVRCRPMSYKELREDDRPIVLVDDEDEDKLGEVVILDPTYFSRKRDYERSFFERAFRYDHSFLPDSSQEDVYDAIGKPLLKHSFEGYNSCLFVYGQTGSGKTYTMVGDQGDRSLSSSPGANEPETGDLEGVVPRLCRGLLHEVFLREEAAVGVETEDKPLTGADGLNLVSAKVLASFYEIYNEKVFDLLSDSPSTPGRVREHPESGAFVEGLHRYEVKSYKDADGLLSVGLEQRAVAETRMNKLSSRSHAVFTLYLIQKLQDPKHAKSPKRGDQDIYTERMSKIILVDLAGSERVSLTGATGERLVEANNINRSLSTLSDVIKALSDKGAAIERERERLEASEDPLNTSSESLAKMLSSGGKANSIFIPYRNSVLTWLLKDCLGGNARTSVLANISPSESSYNETMSTLRYVEKAKLIISTVRVNETSTDPAFVMQLQKHIVSLQERIGQLNKAQNLRDAEVRMQLDAQEKELESEFIRRTIELQDQLHYYRQLHGTLSPAGSPLAASKGEGADENGMHGVGGGGATLVRTLESQKQEINLLSAENDRLKSLLDHKEAIIAEYEDKFLLPGGADRGSGTTITTDEEVQATPSRSVTFATPLREENGHAEAASSSTSTHSSSSSSSSSGKNNNSLGRMRALVLGYKKEKALVQQQYEALLVKVRETTARVESGREHMTKLDVTKNTLQADLSLSRADRNRLKSELASKVEECNTFKSEVDFYRARIEALNAEHKRKTGLMDLHISRMKEAESVIRGEKEEQLDRIAELLAERESLEARWEAKLTASNEGAADKLHVLESSEEQARREKEAVTRALESVQRDAATLKVRLEETERAQAKKQTQLQSAEAEIAELTRACADKDTELGRDRQALHRLQTSLLGVEKESEEAEMRLKSLSNNFSIAIKKSDEELEQLHLECSKRIDELTTARTKNDTLTSQLTEIETNMHRREEEEEKYLATVETLRREVAMKEEAHADAIAGLHNQLKSTEEAHADTLSQKEQAHASALSERDAAHAGSLGDLQDQVKRSEEHARAVEGDSLVKSKGLFGQLDKLQQELKIAEEKHGVTIRELQDTKRRMMEAEASLGKARAEIDKDEHLLENKSKEHDHDVHEMASLKTQVSELSVSVQQKGAEISELDRLVRMWEEESNEANWKLQGKEEEVEALTSQLEALRTETDAAAAKALVEITDLKSTLEQSRTELVVDHNKEEKIIGEKDRQLEMRKEAMRAVSEQLTKTEADLAAAQAEVRELSFQKKQAEDSSTLLREQLTDTEQRLEGMTQTAQNADDVIVQLNRQIKSLQAEVRDADVLVRDLVKKHEKEKEEIEFLKGGGGNVVALHMRQQMDELEEDRTEMMVELQEEREKEEMLEKVAEELEGENIRMERELKQEREKEAELERKLAAEKKHERQLEQDLAKEKEHERELEEALKKEKEHERQLEEDLAKEKEHERELEEALKREKEHEAELEAALMREKEVEDKLRSELGSAHAQLQASQERESQLQAQVASLSAPSSASLDSPAPVPPSQAAGAFAQEVVVAELREKLANAEAAGEALSVQVPELHIEIAELTSQRNEAQAQLEELQSSQAAAIENLTRQLQHEEEARVTLEAKLSSKVDDAVDGALQGQLERNADLEADLEESREAKAELDMVTDVYKSEIAALTGSVEELTSQLAAEREKVQQMVANVDEDNAVVLSVQKQSPDSPGRGGAEADLEAITMSLIETKMTLAHESSEKHELENQLLQTEKSNRSLSSEVSELKLKVGSLTASLKAAEIAAKEK